MTFLEQIRTYEQMRNDWIEECFNKSKSKNSREAATGMLRQLTRFLSEKYPTVSEEQVMNELKTLAKDQTSTRIYVFINEFVQFMISKDLAPRSTALYNAFFKRYLRYNGIRVYNEDIKQFVRLPKIIKERKVPLTYDIISVLLERSGKLYSAFILFLVSSGMRVGELLELKMKDIDFTKEYPIITVRAEIAKTREERITFIDKEAYEVLKPIIAGKGPDDYVIFDELMDLHTVESTFAKIRARTGHMGAYVTGVHHFTIHTFRSFFISQFEKKHPGFGHALSGHGKYMKEYERYTDQEKLEFYKECEGLITINNDSRFRKIIEQKDTQLKELSEMQIKMRRIEEKLKRYESSQKGNDG